MKNWLTNEIVQRVEGFSGTGFMFLELAMSSRLHKISGTLSKHSFKILELKADTFTATFSCGCKRSDKSREGGPFGFVAIKDPKLLYHALIHYYCQRHASPTT